MRLILTLLLSASSAWAECPSSAPIKASVESNHGTWKELSQLQWNFLRGVSVIAPGTPSRLPYGDKAVLVQFPGSPKGLIFFIDGELACDPMPVPGEMVELLDHANLPLHVGVEQ